MYGMACICRTAGGDHSIPSNVSVFPAVSLSGDLLLAGSHALLTQANFAKCLTLVPDRILRVLDPSKTTHISCLPPTCLFHLLAVLIIAKLLYPGVPAVEATANDVSDNEEMQGPRTRA